MCTLAPTQIGTAMPRWGREQPDTVHTWQAWYTQAMDESGKGTAQIETEAAAYRPRARINRQLISKWRNGEHSASPESALIIARVLDRDPVEALRAAGHHTIADQIDALVYEAIHGERILADAKEIAETSDGRDAV